MLSPTETERLLYFTKKSWRERWKCHAKVNVSETIRHTDVTLVWSRTIFMTYMPCNPESADVKVSGICSSRKLCVYQMVSLCSYVAYGDSRRVVLEMRRLWVFLESDIHNLESFKLQIQHRYPNPGGQVMFVPLNCSLVLIEPVALYKTLVSEIVGDRCHKIYP